MTWITEQLSSTLSTQTGWATVETVVLATSSHLVQIMGSEEWHADVPHSASYFGFKQFMLSYLPQAKLNQINEDFQELSGSLDIYKMSEKIALSINGTQSTSVIRCLSPQLLLWHYNRDGPIIGLTNINTFLVIGYWFFNIVSGNNLLF